MAGKRIVVLPVKKQQPETNISGAYTHCFNHNLLHVLCCWVVAAEVHFGSVDSSIDSSLFIDMVMFVCCQWSRPDWLLETMAFVSWEDVLVLCPPHLIWNCQQPLNRLDHRSDLVWSDSKMEHQICNLWLSESRGNAKWGLTSLKLGVFNPCSKMFNLV